MFKIKALNQESSSDEDIPTIGREAQEEVVLEHYNKALRAAASQDYAGSEAILKQLIETNIPQLENNGGLPKSMSSLKYSCYVNLGKIYSDQNENYKALEVYTYASELDATDVTLWTRIGKLSLTESKFRKAAYAFSKGLECNDSHWPCLDNIISVLYVLRDTVTCLVYITKALMIDPNYIKGLVLRRQIYRDNPSTRDYYKLYNQDHIWEPPLDVEISEEDETEILQEAQQLYSRLAEVERTFLFKPFETIPLPKPLEDYTWLSLAETIIYCHQYITDNQMTHFTYVDLSKCMSQHPESVHSTQSDKVMEELDDKEKKSVEAKNSETIMENVNGEKMDCEPMVLERRSSQNSENTNGNDNPDNVTPIHTDNDEEQNTEIENDNETDGDNGDVPTQKGRPKGGTKRKRDVLSDLQIWGWHSKRKPPKKSTKDFTVEDALNRIIPKTLLRNKITTESMNQFGEDSMNTMDIYNMYVEGKELYCLSPIHSPKSVNFEPYFGTDRERDDILKFWTKERNYVDAVVLIKEFVFDLSKLWQYQWPAKLIPLYIQAYNMFREHCDQPQPFCGGHTFEELRNDALATLLYGELITFSSEANQKINPLQLGFLQIVTTWSDKWQEEATSVFIRYQWMQCHIFRKTNQNDLSLRALQLILQEIEEREEASLPETFSLNLPNFLKYSFINKPIIEKIVKHLNMIISLSDVESLFNNQKYEEVIEILKQTFSAGCFSRVGRMGREAQLGILMHSLWYTNWEECFIWTEECLNEALQNYGRSNVDQFKWGKIIEKCLSILLEIIRKETVGITDKLTDEKRCRLVEGLAKIVCIQLNTDGVLTIPFDCVTPWILLHYILLREEHRQYASKKMSHCKRGKMESSNEIVPDGVEHELPPSIAILFSAHEFLGPKGWCLTEKGELLHFILDTVLDRLDTPIFESIPDKIEVHIEQALFCLYLYPSKKTKTSRHLVDHNVDPLPLTWERSFQLYQYYAPESLPEFNSFKNASISADLEQLFKRILALMPFMCDLHTHLPKVMDYIHGKVDKVPEPMDFPNKIRAIYYLLGDYYFKEKEFNRCIKYFQLDLCINPMRLDTWACLALSYTAQLESILNFCEKLKSEADFLDKAKSAQICYRKALELDPEDCVLWIECGSFEYMVHSFCSRLIKYESENFSMEKFELLESEKENYLDSSGNSLEHAISLFESDNNQNEQDERWLQYYILGKIAEKKRKEPTEYIQYYLTAVSLLSENKATYPEKINYSNPQHLAVEALELHYRIHASILKYLELHEGKDIPSTLGIFFKKCVGTAGKHYTTPPPAPPPQQPPTTPKATEPANTTTSFQEQFLNSIKNLGSVPEVLECPESIVQQCLEHILAKVDEMVHVNQQKEDIIEESMKKDEKDEDMDCLPIVDPVRDDVIMISDSEDEAAKDEDKKNNCNHESIEKEEADAQLKDVQYLLDKMMEQTMKDVDKMDDSDPNNSGAEQIEEVTLREEEIPKTEEIKEKTPSNEPRPPEPAKEKQSDSETDTDNRRTSVDEDSSSSSSSTSSSSSSDSDSDDSESGSTSSSEETSGNMSGSEILQLVDKCVNGLEMCVTRLPQNYKALYRLAHLFFNYKGRKDYTKCKQLLLGEYKCKDSSTVNGLFCDRKANNFFNNIWRIPSTEIDRPGSLAAHMNRCISLVLQVLRNTADNKTLIEICMQLRKTPDRDKIYIKETDRDIFSDQAMNMCIQSLKGQVKNVDKISGQQVIKLLMDTFRIYQKVQKNTPNKEGVFSGMLVEVYKNFVKETVPDNVNVLELAVKFCQQQRPGEKPKPQSSSTNVTFVRNPSMGSSPVHPAPNTMVNAPKIMKPPSLGRPRGRPPLPKVPGKARAARAKSPSSSMGMGSFAWQSMYDSNMVYLKHYQDQLMKQYSQGSSLTQLNQLLQVMSKAQLTNPAVAQAITNQFMSPANLLSGAPNLLNSASKLSLPNTMSATGTSSSLQDQNPTSFKGFNQPGLSNLTPEQIKFLEMMLPKQSTGSFKTSGTSGMVVSKSKSATSTKTSSSVQGATTLAAPKPKPKAAPVFKEPSPAMIPVSTSCADDKSGGIYIKDRPNISITPISNLANMSSSSSTFVAPSTSAKAQFTKPAVPVVASTSKHIYNPSVTAFSKMVSTKTSTITSLHKPATFSKAATVAPMAKQITAPPLSKPGSATSLLKTSTVTSLPKPTYIAPALSYTSTSTKQAPAAHSSTNVKLSRNLNIVPPPVSSPSFIKHTSTGNPGKTLQEKLADKKKEQLMKNVEKKDTSVNLLKNLNIPNIPSALSVSPAMPSVRSMGVFPAVNIPQPQAMPKQPAFARYPEASTSVPGFAMEHKLPSALTVSKASPQLPTPRFFPDAGISITQVPSKTKDKPKTSHKYSDKHVRPRPSKSADVSASTKPSAKSQLRVKKDLFPKPSSIPVEHQVSEALASSQKHLEREALSAIKKLSSINIISVSPSSSKKKKASPHDTDKSKHSKAPVICIDSDDE